jgi:hypothetical protein
MRIEKFTISGELPDLNTIIKESKRGRGNWQPYNDLKYEHTIRVMAACRGIKPFNKINVAIEWICKEKRKDKDNVMAGTKFILDGLVSEGVLTNDGWGQIGDITHSFYIDKLNPRINVILTEVGK